MKGRRVQYTKYETNRTKVDEATFHQFGIGCEHLAEDVVQYSTAIIELDDGQVFNVPVDTIKFIKDKGSKNMNCPRCDVPYRFHEEIENGLCAVCVGDLFTRNPEWKNEIKKEKQNNE